MAAVEPRPASTVIVARRPAGSPVEVLLVERSAASRFAPSFVVFPGGTVESGDDQLSTRLFGTPTEVHRACAVRELAEETGLVLTVDGLRRAVGARPGDPGLPPPAIAQLTEIARWVAPESLAVRFDARFFVVDAGQGGVVPRPDGVEAHRAWWDRPNDLLASHRAGDTLLMWPTLRMLEALARCRTLDHVRELRVGQEPPRTAVRR